MRLYENEAKKVFEREGIPVPRSFGIFCRPEDLNGMDLDFPVMLKALVLTGGRGKAGGIGKARDLKEARKTAAGLFGKKIGGYRVDMLMAEKAVIPLGACYLGVTMNPVNFHLTVMASAEGGVDIEETAKRRPDAVLRMEITDNALLLSPREAEKAAGFIAARLPEAEPWRGRLAEIVSALYALFQKSDCKVLEINPLLITPDGPVAADAKMVLDDNGLYRQGCIFSLLGLKDARHDVSEHTPNEIRAKRAGFRYVDLLPPDFRKPPDRLVVGLVPGGAGYGIFSIDEVSNIGERYFSGRVIPFNFMDSGGGPTADQVAEMFHLLMDDERVDIVITSRFGGISSCDTFIRGLAGCLRERHGKKRTVPVHGRMVGTDLPGARDFLEKAVRETPGALAGMRITVGNRVIMADVIREGIERGFEARKR